MSSVLPSPKSPVGIVLIAGGALWLYSRSVKARAALTGASTNKNQIYTNPVGVAGQFAGIVVGITKAIKAIDQPSGNATPDVPTQAKGGTGLGAFGWSSSSITDGIAATPFAGGPLDGWTLPFTSGVANQSISQYGSFTDQYAAAPVYSLTSDFVNNSVPF